MSQKYVDNKMNRSLGRVGMPVGSAVHSKNSSSSYNSRSSSSWDSGISMSSGSSSSHRTYVDNPMNRSLGRVGMELGTAVHSRSDTPKTYVDNSRNRDLGRVGLPHGTAVYSIHVDNAMNQDLEKVGLPHGTGAHSKSDTPKTYVDNSRNRDLGRAGLPHGTAVYSMSETPKTYVDNKMNRDLGRVGLPLGTAVHSKSDTPKTYVDNSRNRDLGRAGLPHGTAVYSIHVDNAMNRDLEKVGLPHGTGAHSKSETPKTYVDNKMNRDLGRVGLPLGTAVHSKLDSGPAQQKSHMDQLWDQAVKQLSHSSGKPEMKVYVDNAFNRRHNRVGLPLGSVPVSRKNELYQDSHLNKTQQEPSAISNQKNCITPEKKVYVDNAFNRKHNRVGLPLGSVPISRKKEVYDDSHINKRKGRVGKPWGTCTGVKNKFHELFKYLEEHSDDDVDIPAEFEAMSDDAFTYVLECLQREKAITQFLEENASNDWQPHEHTLTETIKKHKGQIIDYEKLQIGPKIGHGGFGEVYFAVLESGEAVAVKKLKYQQVTKKRLELFKNEMDLFLQLNHPNIVSFIGACIEVPNLAIVMELMDTSLFDALHVKVVDFTTDNKLEITRGVIDGMAYLHYQDIAHCDLKTKNVLLINAPGQPTTDSNKPVRAKITDFGLSKMKSDVTTSNSLTTANIGTPLYSAPEIHQGKILSLEDLKKADIFSLGLLIWELAVEEVPFEDLSYEQIKVQVGEKGLRPVAPENLRLDGKLQETLSLCWSQHPNKRPTAEDLAEIANTFTNLLEEREE